MEDELKKVFRAKKKDLRVLRRAFKRAMEAGLTLELSDIMQTVKIHLDRVCARA